MATSLVSGATDSSGLSSFRVFRVFRVFRGRPFPCLVSGLCVFAALRETKPAFDCPSAQILISGPSSRFTSFQVVPVRRKVWRIWPRFGAWWPMESVVVIVSSVVASMVSRVASA